MANTDKPASVIATNRPSSEQLSIILPVLNEAKRIGDCLDGLIAQTEEVKEILVVDGGSTDETQNIVIRYCTKDSRVRWIDASPVDIHWTGKAWNLNIGLHESSPGSAWILCVDADIRAKPRLVRSLLAHADRWSVECFSIATAQRLAGTIDGLIHPAMLTTLVYRFGAPGRVTNNRHRVQANGQCFVSRRELLIETHALAAAQASLCEDITIVRRLAECGHAVGFFEAENLIDVAMYENWREIWNNWPRSLPMRDQYFGWREAVGLVKILLLQALPLPGFIVGLLFDFPFWLLLMLGLLTAIRLGILVGTARAYPDRPWTYWLSPLFDLPVVLRIWQLALRRKQHWRGRTYVRRHDGTFEPTP